MIFVMRVKIKKQKKCLKFNKNDIKALIKCKIETIYHIPHTIHISVIKSYFVLPELCTMNYVCLS